MNFPEFLVSYNETVELLGSLIKINSVNPSLVKGGAGEAEIADFVAKFLTDLGLATRLVEVVKDRPNVIGIFEGGEGPSLILNGHLDTVGVDYMKIEPFKPILKDNRMYGRGALDMKGGLAALLQATKAVVERGIRLKGSLIVAATVDEEYASIGMERLMKDCTADAAVVCEPTGLSLVTAHKGFIWATVEIFGTAAHGSRPQEGVDAISKMGKFLTQLERVQKKGYGGRGHRLVGKPSIHASIVDGGRELSTYPDYCKLQLERRTIPGESVEFFRRELQGYLDAAARGDPDFRAKFSIDLIRGPLETPHTTRIVKKLRRSIRKVAGEVPAYAGMSGWTDAEILSNHGIESVLFGPGGQGSHSAVEYVNMDEVIMVAKILSRLVVGFCR